MTSAVTIATRHGTFVAQFNDIGLSRLDFPCKARFEANLGGQALAGGHRCCA